MKTRNLATTACLLVLLAACGGDGSSSGGGPSQPPSSTEEAPQLVITAAGAKNGLAVTQAVDANGATVSASGIEVRIPADAIAGGNITVQPIANDFDGPPTAAQAGPQSGALRHTAQAVTAPGGFPGVGQAVEITSDTPWSRHLTVTFPMSDEELGSGGQMGVAVQLSDGSWRFLSPVRLDAVAHTISAGLPYLTEAGPGKAPAALRSTAAAPAGATTKRVAKSWVFFMSNNSARLPTNTRTKLMVPYTWEFRNTDPSCNQPPPFPTPEPPDPNNLGDDLAPLISPSCWKQVVGKFALRNRRDGFTREWHVDALDPGDSTNGTIDASGEFGAYFTTPDHLRQSKHRVVFKSHRTAADIDQENAIALALVQVFKRAPPKSYSGHVNSRQREVDLAGMDTGLVWQADGELTLEIDPTLLNPDFPGEITTPEVIYKVVASKITGTVFNKDCSTVSAPDTEAEGQLNFNLDTGEYTLLYQMVPVEIHRTSTCPPPPGSPPGTPTSTQDVLIFYSFATDCDPAFVQTRASEDLFQGAVPRTQCFLGSNIPADYAMEGTWELKKVTP